jgi:hypothetical protein
MPVPVITPLCEAGRYDILGLRPGTLASERVKANRAAVNQENLIRQVPINGTQSVVGFGQPKSAL